jgi:hypothetical protein
MVREAIMDAVLQNTRMKKRGKERISKFRLML